MEDADVPAFLTAAALVPPGCLSGEARGLLTGLARIGYAQAAALLEGDTCARRTAIGTLPTADPFTPDQLLDAQRRHVLGIWPRDPRAAPPFYRLVVQDTYARALSGLRAHQEAHAITLATLRPHHTDAPGGYTYRHADREALNAALAALSALLWSLVAEEMNP